MTVCDELYQNTLCPPRRPDGLNQMSIQPICKYHNDSVDFIYQSCHVLRLYPRQAEVDPPTLCPLPSAPSAAVRGRTCIKRGKSVRRRGRDSEGLQMQEAKHLEQLPSGHFDPKRKGVKA